MMKDAVEGIAERLPKDEYRMEFGEESAKIGFAVALARQDRGMSQQELADLLGGSKDYVVRLESGEANPSIAKAGRIFAALWPMPIDQPFPLLGYGTYEPPRNCATEPGVAPDGSGPTPKKIAPKASQKESCGRNRRG